MMSFWNAALAIVFVVGIPLSLVALTEILIGLAGRYGPGEDVVLEEE